MATINTVYTLLQSVNTKVTQLQSSVNALTTKVDNLATSQNAQTILLNTINTKLDALSTGNSDPALAARVQALEDKPEGWGQ